MDELKKLLKQHLQDYVKAVTEESKDGGYVCPICGSGTKENHTGALRIMNNTSWHCFSCGEGGDIFDLYGKIEGVGDFKRQLEGVAGLYGVSANDNPGEPQEVEDCTLASSQEAKSSDTAFLEKAHEAIGQTDYWQKRGLSRDTVDRFGLGYVAEWTNPQAPKSPSSPRLIIPTGETSYLARDTRENIPPEQTAYSKLKVGKIQLFNAEAITVGARPVFVVEGEIDALSVIEAGGEAIALGTTSKVGTFLELCKKNKPSTPLIIALDNDESGAKATCKLVEGLESLGVQYYIFDLKEEYKDVNEFLVSDRKAFEEAVKEAEEEAVCFQDYEDRKTREAYLKSAVSGYLDQFVDSVLNGTSVDCVPTGFKALDEVLDGGLTAGLYVVGAISSLGKTTFVLQMADYIASSGRDVLIFSLEMAKQELIAKSISRLMYRLVANGDTRDAKTTFGILKGLSSNTCPTSAKELFRSAVDVYSKHADHVFITEGVGDLGFNQIREAVENHVRLTGNAPVVVVDYLQILAPYNNLASDKNNTDRAIMELKRISRDFNTPVIGISSLNRASYKSSISMESFKESGAIEYSSDVLIGLQFKGTGAADFDLNAEKQKDVREIELVVLKNRNGKTGVTLNLRYNPRFNSFFESPK